MDKNKKTILSTMIGLAALAGSFLTVTPVQADAVYGQTCNVMVYPYDPSAGSDTLGGAAIPYVNQLNGTNCDSHLKYTKFSQTPDQYQPQPPPNTNDPNNGTPLAAGTTGVRVPWAHHDHEYFNDKTQDSNFIYKSFMNEFEITIQPDGYNNLNLGWALSNLRCWTPVPSDYSGDPSGLFNCSGSAGDLYGGTTVSSQIVGNTIVVTWKFAQNSPNIGRPQLFGNNGTIDSYIKQGSSIVAQVLGLDTSNPYNRGGDFAVEILSNNNAAPVWSATTTSRAMVADLSMLKSSYNSNHQNTAYGCTNSANPGDPSNVGWCYLPRSGGYAAPSSPVISNGVDRTSSFYWYTIGSVSTVWKKPSPPASCTNLSVNPTNLNTSGATPLVATVTTSDGLVHNATLGWTATGGNVTSPTTSGNTPGPFNNTFNLTGATGSVNVNVQTIADGVTIPAGGVCALGTSVSTPPPTTPTCTGLTLTPLILNASGATPLVATVTTNDGVAHSATLQWTATGGNVTSPTTTGNTPGPFNNTFNLTGASGSVNASVQSMPGVVIPAGGVCALGTSVSTPSSNCLNLNSSYAGATVAGGSITPLSASPVNADASKPNAITWTVTGPGELDLTTTGLPMCTVPVINSSNSPTTVPKQCKYDYSTPSTTGSNGSVTLAASPNNGNEAACIQTIIYNNSTITPPPPPGGGGPGPCNILTPTFPSPPGNEVCVTPNGASSGWYNWQVNGSPTSNHTSCQTLNLGTDTWNVQDSLYGATCNGKGGPGTPPPTPPGGGGPPPTETPPTFTKNVQLIGAQNATNLLTIPNANTQTVQYILGFKSNSDNTDAAITDTISGGTIPGQYNAGQLPFTSPAADSIQYAGGMTVTIGSPTGPALSKCGTGGNPPTSNCYNGDIGNGGIELTEIPNGEQIFIIYNANVSETLLTNYCADNNLQDQNSVICQEQYPNQAQATYWVVDTNGILIPNTQGYIPAKANVQSFCQYILTRASGDVFLETQLLFGKDISFCSQYKNSSNIIVTPGQVPQRKLGSTGAGNTVAIGHEVCNQGLTLNNQPLYGSSAGSNTMSSQICEVKLIPGQSWQSSNISSTIQENTTRVSRWTANLGNISTTIGDFGQLFTNKSPSGVYHLKGTTTQRADLTIGNGSDLTLKNGDGANTIIVENGDLYIKNNITYDNSDAACDKTDGSPCTVRDTASLAFIVLNGNVYIDPSVTQISGIIFVQKGDTAGTGNLESTLGKSSTEPLTINGSVYGNIEKLFEARQFAGDPANNQGSIVIRFDESIILNTPPGLQDVLQESQSQVAS